MGVRGEKTETENDNQRNGTRQTETEHNSHIITIIIIIGGVFSPVNH